MLQVGQMRGTPLLTRASAAVTVQIASDVQPAWAVLQKLIMSSGLVRPRPRVPSSILVSLVMVAHPWWDVPALAGRPSGKHVPAVMRGCKAKHCAGFTCSMGSLHQAFVGLCWTHGMRCRAAQACHKIRSAPTVR